MNSQRLTMISVAVVILVIAAFAIVPRLTATQASGDIDYGANPRLGSPDAPGLNVSDAAGVVNRLANALLREASRQRIRLRLREVRVALPHRRT